MSDFLWNPAARLGNYYSQHSGQAYGCHTILYIFTVAACEKAILAGFFYLSACVCVCVCVRLSTTVLINSQISKLTRSENSTTENHCVSRGFGLILWVQYTIFSLWEHLCAPGGVNMHYFLFIHDTKYKFHSVREVGVFMSTPSPPP